MTREEAKKLLPVIQAYVDGKTIESRSVYGTDDWEEIGDHYFDFDTFKYRIKPEPKYRPFVDAEECWNEMLKHKPFGWMKKTKDNTFHHIDDVGDDKSHTIVSWYSYEEMKECFTFTDGTPFGIEEE